jgi:Domain of unknown function (DUF4388)
MGESDRRLGSPLGGASKDAEEEGFDGQLRCSSLADLIQVHCGSRAREAVMARSERGEGHLFFADGEIIHAVVGARVGNAAVYELLEWTTGTFGRSTLAWPSRPTITCSWQELLLTAAHRRDERLASAPAASTSRLKAVRGTGSPLPVPVLISADPFVEGISLVDVIADEPLQPAPQQRSRQRVGRVAAALLVAAFGIGLAWYVGTRGPTTASRPEPAADSLSGVPPAAHADMRPTSATPVVTAASTTSTTTSKTAPIANGLTPHAPAQGMPGAGEPAGGAVADPMRRPTTHSPEPTREARPSAPPARNVSPSASVPSSRPAPEPARWRAPPPRRPPTPPPAPPSTGVEAPPAKAAEPKAWDNDSPFPP